MSKTQNHPKVAHPNRLVSKHEEFLINKSLANKVRHVKSSIPAENSNFERVLVTRQKRETQRSRNTNYRWPDTHTDLEGDQNEHHENNREEVNLQDFYAKDFHGKPADTLPARHTSSSSRGAQDTCLNLAKSGPIQFVSSPRSIIERGVYGKLPANGGAASYRKNSFGASPERAGFIAEKLAEKNREVQMLKSKLAEKSHEIESLQHELKDKWHDDLENQVQNGQQRCPTISTNRDISTKTLKPVNLGKSHVIGMERQNSEARLKKQLSLGSEQKRKKELDPRQQFHYEESLRILERFEEIERSKKKLEPIRKDIAVVKKDLPERPASVKNKTKPNNEKFKIRFSNHLEQGTLKANARYKSDGVEVIDEMTEQEREETQADGDDVEEKLEIKEAAKVAIAAQKRKNNRYQQADVDDEEEFGELESPQIIVTSKTLMLQSQVMNSRSSNAYGFRPNGLTDSEVLIE